MNSPARWSQGFQTTSLVADSPAEPCPREPEEAAAPYDPASKVAYHHSPGFYGAKQSQIHLDSKVRDIEATT